MMLWRDNIDGEAERAQLSLIEDATMKIAESLFQLVELLRAQKASTDGHRVLIPLRPIFSDLAFEFTGPAAADGLVLGLFIAEHAAQLLGHRIEVRSALGRGSCFVVVANAVYRGPGVGFPDGAP